jgi:hypothetical protein
MAAVRERTLELVTQLAPEDLERQVDPIMSPLAARLTNERRLVAVLVIGLVVLSSTAALAATKSVGVRKSGPASAL